MTSTDNPQQHCVCCGNLGVYWIYYLKGPDVDGQHRVWKFSLLQEMLIHFYNATIQYVLCSSITVSFGSAPRQDKNGLQWKVRENPKCPLALHSAYFQKCHCGPITPWTQPFITSSFWEVLQSLVHQNNQTQEHCLPTGHHSVKSYISHTVSIT